jgi:hypothetical protein
VQRLPVSGDILNAGVGGEFDSQALRMKIWITTENKPEVFADNFQVNF